MSSHLDTTEVRNATIDDLSAIVAIQNEYIKAGFIGMFYEKEFVVEERKEWFSQFSIDGPHQILVACDFGKIVGVTYSFAYRGGGVFSRTVETSIYTNISSKAKGIGTLLYQSLFGRISNSGIHRAVVGIALPNDESVSFHRKFDFNEIGVFDEYAFFRGTYISSLWMQKRFTP